MHLAALEVGLPGSAAIVTGTIPLAVGAALAFPMQEKESVSVAFFGDGAINELEFGNRKFVYDNIENLKLLMAKVDDLSQFSDNSFDILFTKGVLAHISTFKINKVIKEMTRIPSKALILMELHAEHDKFTQLGFDGIDWWARDYLALLKQFVPE